MKPSDAIQRSGTTEESVYFHWGKRIVNERQTLEAREAQQKIKDKFSEWIWADMERATRLAHIYNVQFNSLRLRTYDGSHLTFPGMNKTILRKGDFDPHQKNAVWRILQGDSTLLAHCVGAGKTWIMTASAMEARRIGLVKKSMMVVPNHLVDQWGTDFLKLYPQANIFVAGKEHFKAGNRQKAMSRIATGNYDAVIISHKAFELLPVSDDLFDTYMREELDALEVAIREANTDKSNRKIVKILEGAKKRLAKKIADRANREKKDNTITFEELGIDRIFVDEADLYKNLGFVTKMTRVAGLPTSNSNRAADMHIKTRYLRKQNDGKGVVFATGTPISNTMAELYTMQRYLAPEALAKAGMAQFDAWAANFGEAVTSFELSPSGAGYRAIPLGPETLRSIKKAMLSRKAGERNLVFPDSEGYVMKYDRFVHQWWPKLMLRAKLAKTKTVIYKSDPGREVQKIVSKFHPYALRHVAASRWIEMGIMPKRIQELMGHSSLKMTMDIYGHLWVNPAADKEIAAVTEQAFA